MNILHLNDFHLKDQREEKNALRQAFYPEYFESLISKIKDVGKTIDCIFITGDVVHQTAEKLYPHAHSIILYLSENLSVKKEKIYVINGNHDVSRDSGDMSSFETFLEPFENEKQLIKRGERYKFFKEGDNCVLCLDSIGDSYADGKPSCLPSGTKDEIVELVRDQKRVKNIFVLSHHPPESYDVQNQAPFDEESPDWAGKHIWSDGGFLHRRLSSRATINGDVYWFAGDIHRPEHTIINDFSILFITGSVNANEDDDSSILPQARVISTEDKHHSDLYEYNFTGHNKKGLEGCWELKKISAHSFNTTPQSLPKKENGFDRKQLEASVEVTESEVLKTCLIDSTLEKELHDHVIEKQLYEFGRFDTNEQTTSLSWVSTHGLLKSYSIFSSIINAFRKKILSEIPNGFSKGDCLLVGVDSWGSILASRLGAATNIRSCCIAVRSAGDSYDGVERINSDLRLIVKKKKISFVISDVISTGKSISTVRRELGCSECANWYNLTIFCDPSQERGDSFDGYKKTFYLCGSVKMPIIERSKLPGNDILKANISFIQS